MAKMIHRAIAQADIPNEKPDAVTLLRQMHDVGNGLTEASAQSYLTEVWSDRKEWRAELGSTARREAC